MEGGQAQTLSGALPSPHDRTLNPKPPCQQVLHIHHISPAHGHLAVAGVVIVRVVPCTGTAILP